MLKEICETVSVLNKQAICEAKVKTAFQKKTIKYMKNQCESYILSIYLSDKQSSVLWEWIVNNENSMSCSLENYNAKTVLVTCWHENKDKKCNISFIGYLLHLIYWRIRCHQNALLMHIFCKQLGGAELGCFLFATITYGLSIW